MIRTVFTKLSIWLTLWVMLGSALFAQTRDLAAQAVSGELWRKTVDDLAKHELRKASFNIVDNATVRLRRDANLPFSGLITGDVVMQVSMEGLHPVQLSTTVYNKGDNGELSKAEFDMLLKDSINKLNALLKVEPQQRKTARKETGLSLRAWEWVTPDCVALLEASSLGTGKKYSAEFIRLTLAPTKGNMEKGGADDAVKRADLKVHIKKWDDGTVYISGVPMVDQGEKGYCVPATLSRVFAYYGMDGVDQHALAALCRSTGDSGTTLEGMEKALRKISGAFHVNVISQNWLSEKELNREAMRLVQREHVAPEHIMVAMEKHLQAKPAIMAKGFKEIKKQIDAGIPVVWAVALGIFPEEGQMQSQGGHMRLIIGYNEKYNAIVYSDSWGYEHEMKAMSMAQACIITQALYVLRPKR